MAAAATAQAAWAWACSNSALSLTSATLRLQVRDLLVPARLAPPGGLRVREDPVRGPYVEGLTVRPVPDFGAFRAVLEEGSRERTVAATACNATSSRAHTNVQLTVTRSNPGPGGEIRERVSKIDLVDLAGSERVAATGARGRRLEEGASINKSLSALGNCIRALSDMQARAKKLSHSASSSSVLASSSAAAHDASGAAPAHIPFRDSVLTWLLKSSLGGNSKTALVAAVSPGEADHDETLSTLRFADRMQRVETVAVVNEGRRVVPPQAGGGDDAQRASHTGSDRLVRGSATPPRTDAVGGPGGAGGVPSPGDGDSALPPGGDLTAAALRNYRHQRAAAHQRPPRRSRSRKTSNGSGDLPVPGGGAREASPLLAGAATLPARGAGTSTRVTWDSSRVVVNALPAAPAQGGATLPARLGPGAGKPATTRRSLSPQRSLSMPVQRTSPSPAKLRLGNGTTSGSSQVPGGASLQSSTSPLKQRLAARIPPPRRPAGGAPPPPPLLQQHQAPKQQGAATVPPSPPPMPPSPPQQAAPAAAKQQHQQGRPTPLQMPSAVVPPPSLEAEPETVWHLPAYPPTPSHISLPDGDSPSQHAWAPLPPSDGELPRWDSPLTPPVRRKSSLGAGGVAVPAAMLSPVAVAAAANTIVAAVQNQLHDGASAGKAHRLSMEYLERLEHGIATDARRRSSGGGGLQLPPPGQMHVTY